MGDGVASKTNADNLEGYRDCGYTDLLACDSYERDEAGKRDESSGNSGELCPYGLGRLWILVDQLWRRCTPL